MSRSSTGDNYLAILAKLDEDIRVALNRRNDAADKARAANDALQPLDDMFDDLFKENGRLVAAYGKVRDRRDVVHTRIMHKPPLYKSLKEVGSWVAEVHECEERSIASWKTWGVVEQKLNDARQNAIAQKSTRDSAHASYYSMKEEYQQLVAKEERMKANYRKVEAKAKRTKADLKAQMEAKRSQSAAAMREAKRKQAVAAEERATSQAAYTNGTGAPRHGNPSVPRPVDGRRSRAGSFSTIQPHFNGSREPLYPPQARQSSHFRTADDVYRTARSNTPDFNAGSRSRSSSTQRYFSYAEPDAYMPSSAPPLSAQGPSTNQSTPYTTRYVGPSYAPVHPFHAQGGPPISLRNGRSSRGQVAGKTIIRQWTTYSTTPRKLF